MLTKRAINLFLDRPRKDFRVYKTFSAAKLQEKCDLLPVGPPIWSRLNRDQKICFVIGAKMRRFAFWADTGTGKTLLSIALHRYFQRAKVVERSIVLVHGRANKSQWAREIRKHSPKTTYCILRGSSAAKWKQLEGTDAGLIIETYGGMVRLVSKLVETKKGNKLKLELPKLRKICKMFQGLILDASINVVAKKRLGSLMHRICKKISKTAEVVFALNGTPHGRDPTDLWGQMRVVDQGETLGETLGLFRAAFFTEKENYWGGKEYTFKKKMAPVLHRLLANRSIRIEADESSLPAVVQIVEKVSLSGDAKIIYDRAKSELISAHGNFREMKNAFMRMRQISSGYVGYYDDERGVRAKYAFAHNPKLELLLSIIDEVADDYKTIVFHDFVFSGSVIERELEKKGIGYVRLHDSKDDPEELLRRFDEDPKCRVFILNNYEGEGLNLQVARYGIYYESPVSVVKRRETRRRFERQHSKHSRVFLYDLVVQGTADERILQFHQEGKDLFEAVVNGNRPRLLAT